MVVSPVNVATGTILYKIENDDIYVCFNLPRTKCHIFDGDSSTTPLLPS